MQPIDSVSSVRFNAQILNQGIVYYFYRNPQAELSKILLLFLKPTVTLHFCFLIDRKAQKVQNIKILNAEEQHSREMNIFLQDIFLQLFCCWFS